MTIAAFIIALVAVLAIVATAKDPEWHLCPLCKHFHKGNISLPSLPPDADGTIRTQVCMACQMPEEQPQKEAQKEFSR